MKEKDWWRSKQYDDVVDPISLDPISSLKKEPFVLHTTCFDAEILASYLVSTASFCHPTTRRAITRQDCLKLDEHLKEIDAEKRIDVVLSYDTLNDKTNGVIDKGK